MSRFLFSLARALGRANTIVLVWALAAEQRERRAAAIQRDKEYARLERPAYLSKHGRFKAMMRGALVSDPERAVLIGDNDPAPSQRIAANLPPMGKLV